MQLLEDTKNILGNVLGLGARKDLLTETSPLLGAIPEFDSMAVVSLIAALEDHFGISIQDNAICAETFETVGSLTRYLQRKTAA